MERARVEEGVIAIDNDRSERDAHELLAADRAGEIHAEMHRQRVVSVIGLVLCHR